MDYVFLALLVMGLFVIAGVLGKGDGRPGG